MSLIAVAAKHERVRPSAGCAVTSVTRDTPILVGRIYRAKHPRLTSQGLVNDRQVVFAGPTGIQFDSPTIGPGQRLPFITAVEFREWAGQDVTALFGPHGDWHGRPELADWQAAQDCTREAA